MKIDDTNGTMTDEHIHYDTYTEVVDFYFEMAALSHALAYCVVRTDDSLILSE